MWRVAPVLACVVACNSPGGTGLSILGDGSASDIGAAHSMVFLTQGIHLMLAARYDGVVTSGAGSFDSMDPYCRVGSDVAGTEADGTEWTKPCTDPFL